MINQKNDLEQVEAFYQKNYDAIKRYFPYAPTFALLTKAANHWISESGLVQLSDKKLRVLDLGTCGGHLLYLYEQMGFEAVGLEMANEPFMQKMTELLGVNRIIYKIEKQKDLLEGLGKFDYITAYNVTFDYEWQPKDWEFFINSLRKNNFNDGGKMFFILNYHYQKSEYQETWARLGMEQENNRIRSL
jgi:2-polyprenyl-3-methyl-5-hydroxy-6-metoxy-1,4-benzoquinol methylase